MDLRGREAPARPVLPVGQCGSRGTPSPGDAGTRLPPADYERIEDLIDFAPIRGAIAEALESLRNDHREALRYRVIEQLSYPEVARRLSCTEDNARQRVSRGLRRLGVVLQERGLQPAAEPLTEKES